MYLLTISNYSTNFNKNFLEANLLFYFYFISIFKIKYLKSFFLLNIKQIIFILINTKNWKKIIFKNIVLKIINKKNKILDNLDANIKLILKSKINININFKNLFNKLKNIIWTNIGYYDLIDFESIIKNNKIDSRHIIVESIDKIPFLTKYIVPKYVRISNTNRVRLGSYLSKGITIMSEGYVNFNTFIGKNCMIEGRISAGVKIFENCDIGGSASIMGTLSGGGNKIISIGTNCLLGANSGLGICLGDNCIIEAGLYVTYNCKIKIVFCKIIIVKAKYLSFLNNIIIYRNSLNGTIECRKIKKIFNVTNIFLHKN